MSTPNLGDIEDLEKLVHWHPEFLTWKSWEEIPADVRESFAERMRVEAQNHDERAARVRAERPNQTRFESMWAHAARLAASHLFDATR